MKQLLLALLTLSLFNFSYAADEFDSENDATTQGREEASQNRPKTVIVRENLETGEMEYLTLQESIAKDENIDAKIKSLASKFSSVNPNQVISSLDEIDKDDETASWYFYFYSKPYAWYYPAYYSYTPTYSYAYTYTPYYYNYWGGYGYRCFW